MHGYDATTTAEIAARAGVTERTFFRHFADKREAFFDGEDALRDALAAAIATAEDGLSAIETLLHAFRATLPLFEQSRQIAEPRRAIIARTPALQERVLTKTAKLVAALAAALIRRGVEAQLADLVASAGMTVLRQAVDNWYEDETLQLDTQLTVASARLRLLTLT